MSDQTQVQVTVGLVTLIDPREEFYTNLCPSERGASSMGET